MATKEFYIRNASETEARGPFNLEQLSSLAEAGQVTPDTLYYDAMEEKWCVLGEAAELRAQVFPEKKKLTLKKETLAPTLNKPKEGQARIEVTDILAAAEARTHDTAEKGAHLVEADRCAKWGTYGCIFILLTSLASSLAPHYSLLLEFTPDKLLEAPVLVLGAFDLLLALLLGLGMVSLYPLVRFRAMLGLGFLGFLFYSQGENQALLAVSAGSLGLYGCTLFIRYASLGLSLVLGLGGMGVLVWLGLG